jgi:hypothetical protein
VPSVVAAPQTAPSFALDPAPGVIPRWLLLLVGAAAATVAVAGLREISWLVGPVFLALVVVIALTPVQRWLRRHGAPRWLATAVLLILVWGVLLSFVGLLVLSVAQMAALLPNYADQAQTLITGVVHDLTTPGSSPVSCPTSCRRSTTASSSASRPACLPASPTPPAPSCCCSRH